VAVKAQRDEILFVVFARVTAKLFVVDFEVCHRAAKLAAPAVSPQYLLAKFPVIFLLEPDRPLFRRSLIH